MTEKTNIHSKVILILALVFCLFVVLWVSYFNAKETAQTFVGPVVMKVYPLDRVMIYFDVEAITNEITGIEASPLLCFTFSHPTSFDDEFQVYTSMLGEIIMTNPTGLNERLRTFEKKKVPSSE